MAPGAHVGLLVDQAGWPLLHQLIMPPNITVLLCLPNAPS
jgi:hypothetical protein